MLNKGMALYATVETCQALAYAIESDLEAVHVYGSRDTDPEVQAFLRAENLFYLLSEKINEISNLLDGVKVSDKE